MDFIAYCLFILCGWFIGGIIVYPVYQRLLNMEPGGEKKGIISAIIAVILVVFGASR